MTDRERAELAQDHDINSDDCHKHGESLYTGWCKACAADAITQARLDEREACVQQLRALLSVIEAHDCISLSCDRDGEQYCDCLQEASQKARQFLEAVEARPADADSHKQ